MEQIEISTKQIPAENDSRNLAPRRSDRIKRLEALKTPPPIEDDGSISSAEALYVKLDLGSRAPGGRRRKIPKLLPPQSLYTKVETWLRNHQALFQEDQMPDYKMSFASLQKE